MPSRRNDRQVALPFDDRAPAPEPGLVAAPDAAVSDVPRRGRPRKWSSEAERKRAYRERLAADLAEPDRLRRELRSERAKVARREREIDRLRHELDRANQRAAAADDRRLHFESIIEGLESKVDDWRSRAQALSRNLDQERKRHADDKPVDPAKDRRTQWSKLPDLRAVSHRRLDRASGHDGDRIWGSRSAIGDTRCA